MSKVLKKKTKKIVNVVCEPLMIFFLPLLQCWTGGAGGGGAELCFWLGFEQEGGGTLPFLIALAEGFLSFPFPTQ